VKLSYLWRGMPGHPLHPPLTDAVIGMYVFALIAALLSIGGFDEEMTAEASGLAIEIAIFVSIPTAITGIVDWWRLPKGTAIRRTATFHMIAMFVATAVFFVVGEAGSFGDGEIDGMTLVLVVVGFVILTLGGWLGGSIVFEHGMRVLGLEEARTRDAVSPAPTPEERAAERG
jgi:uncharacterized membrane protein